MNKPNCCEKCEFAHGGVTTPKIRQCKFEGLDRTCPCHTPQTTPHPDSCKSCHGEGMYPAEQTTPHEEWEKEFDAKFTAHNLRDNLSEQKVARYIKDFIRETRTAAYEEGKESVNEIYLTRQEAYEKGIRDSLEMVEHEIDKYFDGLVIIPFPELTADNLQENLRKAISTLLK